MFHRLSIFAWLFPGRYIRPHGIWDGFDLYEWSKSEYMWASDGPFIWQDKVQLPAETIVRGTGDCDDYALVAASWAKRHGRDDVGLAICGHKRFGIPIVTHMIAVDESRVYSSGHIFDGSVDDWLAASDDYDFAWVRQSS